ncbi:MAG: hypothetical protein IPK26_30310 [Planctomycetes bacterium]|nr:hypothetical protein [Planctomycetota bacterium]
MWGPNLLATTIPALPPGLGYTDVAVSHNHAVALRTDGTAVAWGDNMFGKCNIPALPTGTRYVDLDASAFSTVLLRSDGQVLVLGDNGNNQRNVPGLPPGRHYVRVAASDGNCAALVSDGTVIRWGASGSGSYWVPLPPLPAGVVYVEIEGGGQRGIFVARRSDGQVVGFGMVGDNEHFVPPLQSGTSYVQVAANLACVARVGPTSTYVTFAAGCAGSGPVTRLVPADTPRIGTELRVRLFDLPANQALMLLGFEPAPGLPRNMDRFGLTGCLLQVAPDAVSAWAGTGGTAVFSLPIPDAVELIGIRFANQAFVFDPTGNPAGAVLSDAARAVVGAP